MERMLRTLTEELDSGPQHRRHKVTETTFKAKTAKTAKL